MREQIGQLTGTGYLSGYADDESQYRALLTRGATFAKEHQLVPGVALTAEQMSQLTSDLVWLVEQTVTLADGTTQRVLVPQVYLVPREGDLLPSGSLIAGGRVEMALSGDFTNGGDVRGGVVDITAQNIANTGDMRGTTLALTARDDLRNIGGSLSATGDMSLTAGRDIVMETTTASGGTKRGNVTTTATVLDQVASLSAGGVMVVKADRDITMQAVQITQGGADGAGADGGVLIQAGRDLSLTTVQTSSSRDEIKNANNYKKESQHQDVGTALQAEGAIVLKAGQDLTATAAQIASAQGEVTLGAGRDVQLLAGEANSVVEEMTQKTKKSLFKKKTVTTYNKTDETTAIGTTVSGDTVNIVAGRDITLAAAQAVSDNGTKLIADRDITIDGVTNSVDTEQFKKTVKSGLFSGGGIGVTIGKQELSQATKSTQETNQGSMVGSVNGDVDILAGGKYKQIGSEVQAPGGNVTIQAKSIEIEEARNKSAQDSETKFKQAGVTLALSAPGISTAMDATKAAEHVTQTQDDRMKALAAATAISKAMQAVDEIKKLGEAMNEANQNAGIRLSLTVGSSQSKSTQHNESDQAVSSAISAGKNLSLIASGGGADSNVTVRGSALTGQDVLIKADNAINLMAAGNSSEQHSKDSSTSASVGIGVTLGKQNSLGFTASASVSKGNSDGTDNYFTTTQVTGGSSVKLESGGDATLQGAVVSGPKVSVDVGGNLKIESLQDTAKFDSKSMSAGGSVTIGYGSSASGNFSQSKVTADFAAVGEQAGIRAGDGGFQVNVKGNTDLKGGAITSSQAAIDAGNNSLSTGTLTTSDIENRSQFKASAVMVSAGTGGGMAGAFKDSDDDRSTTRSTISAGSTTITSGDAASQAALDKLDRGATNDATAGKLAQGWDGQQLAQQAKVNAQIVAEFGAQAAKEVADFAATKTKAHDDAELYLALKGSEDILNAEQSQRLAQMEKSGYTVDVARTTLNDPQVNADYDAWKEGGAARAALHAVVGGLTGDLSGALGAAASSMAAPAINDLQSAIKNKLVTVGVSDADGSGAAGFADGLAKLATGLVVGAVGSAVGVDGGVAAINQDYNNRQLHQSERDWIKGQVSAYQKYIREKTGESVSPEDAYQRLLSAGYAMVDNAALQGGISDPYAKQFIAERADRTDFVSTAAERSNYKLLGNADGSFTPEQQARFGMGKPAEQASVKVTEALSMAGPCGTNCAAKFTAFDDAIRGLQQARVLYQDDPSSVQMIDLQVLQLLTSITKEEVVRGAATKLGKDGSALVDLIVNAPGALTKAAVGETLERVGLIQAIKDARLTFSTSDLRRSGNVAAANIDIPGVQSRMVASSRISETIGQVVGRADDSLPYSSVPNVQGGMLSRNTDSEYKILDNVAAILGANYSAKGTITIVTERVACSSCSNAAEKFMERYPNITVKIFDNSDIAFKPSKIAPTTPSNGSSLISNPLTGMSGAGGAVYTPVPAPAPESAPKQKK
ncbi:hemagglutinin repeat-containing protein [Mitsuaria sp. CC2]|uniref:hemagglutinin repeat-containing protein n=1 Tax=Mitsuaria sp. CC2 TaxID=3029186 RepID=UPI003B8B746D